jgi:GNAT superfamily N-acetyltransferase
MKILFELEYEIRPYHPGDEEQIVPLLQLVFNGWRTLDFWRWKYRDNPLKKSIVVVGVSDKRIIGVGCTVFKRVKIGDKITLCCYGTDTGVHPDFRRKGVYSSISKLVREIRRKEGAIFNFFGTENPIVSEYHTKTDHVFPHPLLYLYRIRDLGLHLRKRHSGIRTRLGFYALKLVNTLKNAIAPEFLSGHINISEIRSFGDGIDAFWDEVKDSYDFILERTRKNLNWSYCDPRAGDFTVKQAEEDGRILGYIVIEKGGDEEYPEAEIVDLLTVPRRLDAADALLADAVRCLDDGGVNLVKAMALDGNPYKRLYERHGFLNVRRKIHVIYYSVPGREDEHKILESTAARKAHLSRGDLI